MTANFPRLNRAEILRAVISAADRRRDGRLPMHVAGVLETYADELTLLGALQLRWHTRLAGHLERQLMGQPMDLEQAVVRAWQATADELPGVLAVVDRHRAAPLDKAMAAAMVRSQVKERALLAAAAGQGMPDDPASAMVGERIEQLARDTMATAVVVGGLHPERVTLLDRLRTRLAA